MPRKRKRGYRGENGQDTVEDESDELDSVNQSTDTPDESVEEVNQPVTSEEPLTVDDHKDPVLYESEPFNPPGRGMVQSIKVHRDFVEVSPVSVPEPEKGFVPVKSIQTDLISYVEAMDPKKSVNPAEGGRWQYSLFNSLITVLNNKDQTKFNQEWNTVLGEFVKHQNGVFGENFVFRFPAEWTGTPNQFTTFRRLVTLIISTANPQTRTKALAQINLDLVTRFMSENQKTRLINFYGA